MQSGKFRQQVTLQRRTDSQAAGGQVVHNYEDVSTDVWANIAPLKGRELITAQQVQSEITTVIGIRWRDGVDETWRIKHVINHDESPQWFDIYDVIAAMPDEKTGRRELKLMCVRRIAEGWRG